jgi:hypothetical protein
MVAILVSRSLSLPLINVFSVMVDSHLDKKAPNNGGSFN